MSDTVTPGQVAYHAYCQSIYSDQAHLVDYDALAAWDRAAWEAVAQAVLDAWQAQPRVADDPGKARP